MIELAAQAPRPEPIFEVGQAVRVRKNLTENVHAIRDLLGQEGIVEDIIRCLVTPRAAYYIRFPNGRMEMFETEELDGRYARRKDSA